MKHYRETKIGRIIADEFDSRLELAVIMYLIQHGTDMLKDVSEDDILKVTGDAMMTAEFCQSLVRTAVRIAKECTETEVCEYIRKYICMEPQMKEVTFYKDNYSKANWEYICHSYAVNTDQDSITIVGFVEEE